MYQDSNQQLVDSYMRAIEIRDKEEKSHYPDLMAELNRANRENKQQRDRILILENTVSLMRPRFRFASALILHWLKSPSCTPRRVLLIIG